MQGACRVSQEVMGGGDLSGTEEHFFRLIILTTLAIPSGTESRKQHRETSSSELKQ